MAETEVEVSYPASCSGYSRCCACRKDISAEASWPERCADDSRVLGRVIRREARHLYPSPDRVSLVVMAAMFLVLVAGAATWIAVASTPTEKFLP